ncbi:PH domain-containing protein [Evansella sp. AB-P1]|uniref:PH domain-containing protein n=1 Tax=Evansella sp. AB-P1 TaxID=3037653 RepID=UPI00241C6EFD|nr:PH domain-containing protein [Evansella sp. AB-P1]MDG5787174.1 PH domain-containing protein [Evansella sp. AB-P1]
MIYKTKRDKTISFSYLFIFSIFIGTTIPLFIYEEMTIFVLIYTAFVLVITLLLAWNILDIKYEFLSECLLVKGGFFRSKIYYSEITKISTTTNPWYGYRIMGASKGIEIFYNSALMGSVKISPKEEEHFVEELKKRTNLP